MRRTTAEVLIRRGHSTPDAARAFLEQDGPAHDPMLLGDMAAACERIERAISAGERVCVHGDYDADGICATALAVLVAARARRPGRVAPPEPVRQRATGWPSRRSSGWRATAFSCSSPSTAASRPQMLVARAARAGHGRHRHRPPPAGRDAARVHPRLHPPVGLPVPGAVRDRRRVQARPGAPRPRRPRPGRAGAPPRPGRAGDRRRRRAAVETRTAGSCGRGCAGCGARQSPACGRSWRWRASTAPTRRRPTSGSGSRRGSTPPAGCATPTRRSSSC